MKTPAKYPVGAAPGYRDAGHNNGYGALRYVGNGGYSWSSTIPSKSTYAYFLYFNTSWLLPQNSHYRGNGFPLRCLQE